MSNKRIAIPPGGKFQIDEGASYAKISDIDKLNKRQDNSDETMRAVVIILLVMVATMIFSLQIAIWQSKQEQTPQQPSIIYIRE